GPPRATRHRPGPPRATRHRPGPPRATRHRPGTSPRRPSANRARAPAPADAVLTPGIAAARRVPAGADGARAKGPRGG
ncbi:hypothetical protein ABZS87_22950, partial [Streptomyces sp. NPDC005336]